VIGAVARRVWSQFVGPPSRLPRVQALPARAAPGRAEIALGEVRLDACAKKLDVDLLVAHRLAVR
jgi:hypothetical protein